MVITIAVITVMRARSFVEAFNATPVSSTMRLLRQMPSPLDFSRISMWKRPVYSLRMGV